MSNPCKLKFDEVNSGVGGVCSACNYMWSEHAGWAKKVLTPQEDKEQFEEAFYNWLLNHGVDLASFESSRFDSSIKDPFIAKIDLNKLKVGIIELMKNDYKQGFGEGQDSMLYNGQIELVTVEEAKKYAIAHADKVIGEDAKNPYGKNPEMVDYGHALAEYDAFVRKGQRERNK